MNQAAVNKYINKTDRFKKRVINKKHDLKVQGCVCSFLYLGWHFAGIKLGHQIYN